MAEYKTLRQAASDEFTERHSRFIGYARPVSTEEDAVSFINEIRQKHWDASHNTYAYILRENGAMRYSDDGEPQGTAGLPILEVLKKSGITDAVVVVTRYFGGVLLGKGGLLRAYSHGAAIAVNKAEPVIMRKCLLTEFSCDYGAYGRVAALVPSHGGVMDDTIYTDCVTLRFHIPEEDFPRLQKELTEASSGQIEIKINGEKFFEFLEDF